ncbi:MAG: hypothetical protein MJ201_03170 [Mycoplasmoidaceae bacterium]|nr:hypothetical protein [Mycoplasmoidaceae bacterium]
MYKTINYETSAGTIFLVNKDREQLLTDLERINEIEHNHLDRLYLIAKPPKPRKHKDTLRELVNEKGK